MKHLKEHILERIGKREFSMRPKIHFFLKGAFFVVVFFLVLFFAIYLVSFVIFTLHARGAFLMGEFGLRGLYEMLIALPLTLLFCAALTLGITEYLSRYFSFNYRRPVLVSLGGLLIIVGATSGILFISGAHEIVRDFAAWREVPGIHWLYREYSELPLPRGYPGVIKSTTTKGFMLETFDGETYEVTVDSFTHMPQGTTSAIGMEVFVGGEREGNVIEAFGVLPLYATHPLHIRCKNISADKKERCSPIPIQETP